MNKLLIFGVLLFAVLGKKEMTDFPMIDGVIQVDDDNIDDILDTTYEIVLMFCNFVYMSVCIDHREPYVRAAQFLSKLEKPLYIGEVDPDMNFYLVDKYNVTEFPTFMCIYSFGREPEKLQISQTDVGIVKEVMRRSYQNLIEVKNRDEWENYKSILSISTIGVFETKDCEEFEKYESLSQGKNNAVFFYSLNPEVIPMGDSSSLYSFHHVDQDTTVRFTGDMTNYNQMSDFIDMNELPLVIDYRDKVTAREIFASKRVQNQLVLFYNKTDPAYEDILHEFYIVAKETLGRTYCIKAELKDNERLARHLGMNEERTSSFVIHNNNGVEGMPRKYLFEGEVLSEDLLLFIDKALRFDKSLRRLYVSEKLPTKFDFRGNCGKTVQQTWERDVMDPTKDVMVLYEAARCTECISMELTFISFSEDYEETENLAFYQAFVDRNEFTHKSTQITSFPAIRFYPRSPEGKKHKWVNYHESMTTEGLERFLRKYATVELPEPEDDDDL